MAPLPGIASASRPRLPPPSGPVAAGGGLYAALGFVVVFVVLAPVYLGRHNSDLSHLDRKVLISRC